MIGRLTTEEIEEVLSRNTLGHIGCNNGYDTYVIPVNYAYDGKFILAHSQPGMKIQIMRKNPRVCFEVEEIINFNTWKSVIAFGEYQELISERDRYDAMQFFIDKMLHIKVSKTAGHYKTNVEHSDRPIMYRICIDEKSGRFETESPEAS